MSTPEKHIGESAKICYGTKSIEDGGKDITSTLVHEHKHLASLRFAYMSVHIEGISVACQNQIVRSKHLDFMVQSKRYVNADKGEFEFIMPEGLDDIEELTMKETWETLLETYKALLKIGVKKEDARAILPANTSTKMNVTGNLQAWMSFFTLRLDSHAQKEVRAVANSIWNHASDLFPQVFTEATYNKLTKVKDEARGYASESIPTMQAYVDSLSKKGIKSTTVTVEDLRVMLNHIEDLEMENR